MADGVDSSAKRSIDMRAGYYESVQWSSILTLSACVVNWGSMGGRHVIRHN